MVPEQPMGLFLFPFPSVPWGDKEDFLFFFLLLGVVSFLLFFNSVTIKKSFYPSLFFPIGLERSDGSFFPPFSPSQ